MCTLPTVLDHALTNATHKCEKQFQEKIGMVWFKISAITHLPMADSGTHIQPGIPCVCNKGK